MMELKPCPFCGGEDLDVHVAAYFGRLHEDVTITCNDCIGSIYGSTEERAAAAWNTRHVETCKVEGSYYSELMDVYVFSLSCGDSIWWNDEEPPKFCPECGRKVER